MEYREDIEQLVKNTFDNFEPEVHPDVWTNIQNSLNVAAASTAGSATNTVSTGAKLAVGSSKFSLMAVIGVTSVIVSITAAIIYFSTDNQTPNKQPEKEANNIQNVTPVIQDSKVESKNISQSDNLKKEDQPVATATFPKTIDIDKGSLQGEHSSFTKENGSADKTSIDGSSVSGMEKKDATGVTDDKNNHAELKQPDYSAQPVASVNTGEQQKENNITDDLSQDQSPDAEKKTPSKDEEKPIEYYLGHISNVITPNADGNNDVFVIEGKEVQSLKVTIFDRSGKIIHHWNNLHGFWDGKLNSGQPASTGEYIYSIFAQTNNGNPLTKKGSLHLLLK